MALSVASVAELPRLPIVWTHHPGAQQLFLAVDCFEALYHGTRGSGKTDALIIDFAQHVDRGYGKAWRGILFRESYKQLEEVRAKTERIFHAVWPAAEFNASDYIWRWPAGETLYLRYMRRPADYWNYHGHEYPWIGWEELTQWSTAECYRQMMSCCRSADRTVPRRYRANTNPWGRGHNWVKSWFIDRAPAGVPFINPETNDEAVHVFGCWAENQALLEAEGPRYATRLAADSNEHRRRAWLLGDWTIVAGGMFDDIWQRAAPFCVLAPFELPTNAMVRRAFDWGSSSPFCVGWWWCSTGEPCWQGNRQIVIPRGSWVRLAEWYGWNGRENEGLRMLATDIAAGILQRERAVPWGRGIVGGVAGADTFVEENGRSIAAEMATVGVSWSRADTRAGSRRVGWETIRGLLAATIPSAPGLPADGPGLYIVNTCQQWLRTVPTMSRDEADPDDINTDAEDHCADETRMIVTARASIEFD